RAVRAFAESDLAGMPAQAPAQITAADLTDATLQVARWGTPRGEGLALLTPPPRAEIEAAEATLRSLGLVDDQGRPTPSGTRVAQLPVGAREARALLDGARRLQGGDTARRAAEIVAAVSDDHRPLGADLPRLLRELREGRGDSAARWKRETERLTRIAAGRADDPASPRASGTTGGSGASAGDSASEMGAVLALARPERIARRTAEGSRSYLLASGTRAALPEGRSLLGSPCLLHRERGAPCPARAEESLLTGLETGLAPQVSHRTTRLDQIDLASGLRLLLPWPEASRLEELAPERLAVPSGSTARIDYPEPGDPEGRPVVAVKLQELFGLAETPRLVDGRVPVLFHLLSPARRPLAVTDDLRSFWD